MRFLTFKPLFLMVLAFFLVPETLFAAADPANPVGWGADALNLMTPIEVLQTFVVNACIVLGVTFLFATFIKYRQHRMNQLHVPLSTVVFLLIVSLLLLCLPLVHYLLEYLNNN